MGGGFDGGHGAGAGGEVAHEGGAVGDEVAGVGEGEDAGGVGCGDLADGVADDGVGGDAHAAQESCEGDLEGEQAGLCVGGVVDQVGVLAKDDLRQGVFEVRVEECADLVEGGGEDGEAGVQLGTHARALAALAGEQPHRLPRQPGVRNTRSDDCGVVDSRGEGVESFGELVVVFGDDGGAVVEYGAGGGQGPADVGR